MIFDSLAEARALENELIQWRRHLHMNPELSFQEVKTSQFVASKLREFGYEVQEGIAKTGVVAIKKGNTDGPTIGIRADMDALPIQDQKNAEYSSTVENVAHLCGHDAHTSILLGVAKILKNYDLEKGIIKFIFQPAEEGFAGAKHMVEEGVLTNPAVDGIIALHVNPKVESGIISHCEGPATAYSDKFDLRIIGDGGHAAHPHLSIDSITIATTVVNTMQQIVSRTIEPLEPVVLTFGKIEGGFNHNIIAPEVKLSGTVRTLNPEVKEIVKDKMKSYLKHICEGMGAKYEFDYRDGYPAVYNDPELTPLITDTITTLLGEDYLVYSKPTMGGEDFSFFTNEVPGVIFKIGTGNSEETQYPLHHPMFDLDENVLPVGVASLAELSINYIKMLEERGNNEIKL